MNKFREKQLKYCKENEFVPTDCVIFAFGRDYYNSLNRGTDVRRLCISDQIGDDV